MVNDVHETLRDQLFDVGMNERFGLVRLEGLGRDADSAATDADAPRLELPGVYEVVNSLGGDFELPGRVADGHGFLP